MPYAFFLILLALALIIYLAWAAKNLIFYIKVPRDTALIVTGPGTKTRVHFDGATVWPLLNKKTFVPMPYLPVKMLFLSRDALVCRNGVRAEVRVVFYLKLKAKSDDVLQALETMELFGIADVNAVSNRYKARFTQTLRDAVRELDFQQIMDDRAAFCRQLTQTANYNLNGYKIEEVCLEYFKQIPET